MKPAAGLRRSSVVFALIGALALMLALEAAHAAWRAPAEARRIAASAGLVRSLGLTDLALFTEARYARHPALADLHSAFQDNPMSFEHFPSGSFVPLPHALPASALGFSADEVSR
jgi:hypothetical protein